MNKNSPISMPRIYTSLLYLCGLFLFIEWLLPIEEVTDTSNITVFVIYAIYCFFISLFSLRWWANFLLKGFGLFVILHGLFFDMLIFSREWFNQLAFEMAVNIDILISQNWYYLSPFFRSFLFLVFIWLMSYLLHYWFLQMKRIFLFILLTFVYITILDTFTTYDATIAIVRTFVISFVALAMANFNRELEREKIAFSKLKRKARWSVPLVLTIVISVAIGVAAPKFAPIWPDPVPFIESAASGFGSSGGSVVRKVGYGENDSQLGGSFIQDDTPVFRVAASDKQYWRIETKDVYTGKGWETSAESSVVETVSNNLPIDLFDYSKVETEEAEATVYFLEGWNFDKLVYPYGVKEIHDLALGADVFFDPVTESLEVWMDGELMELQHYRLIYESPSFPLDQLRDDVPFDEDLSRYLQLPDTLPERVFELAEEITASYDTMYEKVQAIERYFAGNGFTYETVGVSAPGPDQDYVDQFLFETKIGYCDNFSTSMAVMLRTLDIPARWVKGFTGGEVIGAGENLGEQIYEITNANAHSWVEVYFPELGWVPFEPTQGFTNPTVFHLETSEATQIEHDEPLEIPEGELPEADVPMEMDESEPVMAEPVGRDFQMPWKKLVPIMLVIFIVVFLLYKFRFRIKMFYHYWKLGSKKDEQAFQDAYHHLLNMLDRDGYKRRKNQTLREYAKQVDARYRTKEMKMLTAYYERMLYRNEFDENEWRHLRDLWRNLLKTIAG